MADAIKISVKVIADSLLASGEAKTKQEARAKARLEIAKRNTEKAKEKMKQVSEAVKKLEQEQKKKERFAASQEKRKHENQKKYALGGLVLKAGLGNWDVATLLGGLIAMTTQAESMKAVWRGVGAAALNAPKGKSQGQNSPSAESAQASVSGEQQKPGVFVSVETPGGKPTDDICATLKKLGLRWLPITYDHVAKTNEIPKSWQGKMAENEISRFNAWVESWGGVLVFPKDQR